MAKRKTHEEFVEQLNKIHGENVYIPLGEYKGANTKIKIRHNCGYEWEATPNSLLRGQGCPKCAGNIKKTTEEFKKEIYDKYGNEYEILGEYVNSKIKILVKHNKCGYEWNTIPSNLLKGEGCPQCKGGVKRTHEEFIKIFKEKYNNEYTMLEKYINSKTKILIKHNKCGYEWKIRPVDLLRGQGCPVCSNPPKAIVLGINTTWDTDRWMVDLGISEEDAKRYSRGSGQKITVKCPDCGREKEMKAIDIYRRKSIGCSCGDGKSYPEKFIMSVLEQLDLEFETEYKPKWIENKRYDFYIKGVSCIIETHGKQHYDISFKNIGGRTLEEEQLNDKCKKEVALKNGIKRYIELDCRESNLEWIKNSILHSELANLFDLNNIKWNKCAEFANKNIVKEVCNYWNNKKDGETTVGVSKKFKLSKNTIQTYLKRGNKLGWCDYDPKEEINRARSKGIKQMRTITSKKIEAIKNGKSLGIFLSCNELSRQSEKLFGVKLVSSSISRVCTGKKPQYKGFTFKYVD